VSGAIIITVVVFVAKMCFDGAKFLRIWCWIFGVVQRNRMRIVIGVTNGTECKLFCGI